MGIWEVLGFGVALGIAGLGAFYLYRRYIRDE